MKNQLHIKALLAMLFVFALQSVWAETAKPNILFIVADDLGWADVGWHNAQHHKTPTLDKLVHEGVELDRHYVQPVCSPTRTALLSGRWTSRFGPHVLQPTNLRAFPLGTVTMATALKASGYETYLSGKWHLGSKAEWGPNNYGFDHAYGSMAGAADPWTHQYRPGPFAKTWHRDGKVLDEEGNATELVAKQAEAWIREKHTPWFVYVPFTAVHIPVDTPDEYKKIYASVKFYDDPKKNDSALRYAAFVSQLDAKVGQLVKALDETGQRANTLIVFTSDNGGLLSGGNAYISKVAPTPVLASNLPLRGQKAQLYEGGIRVCAFANWPGQLAQRKVTAPMHAADWMPTLCKLVGYKPTADLKWDGMDIWPLLTGAVEKPAPRAIYVPLTGKAAILNGDWKMIAAKKSEKCELFNLTEDPYEKNEISAKHPEKVNELEAILEALRKDDLTTLPPDLKDQDDSHTKKDP